MGVILGAHYTHQDLDFIPGPDLGIFRMAGGFMSLYDRLVKIKDESQDIEKKRRVTGILMRRYDYGAEQTDEDYRRADHFDEIREIDRRKP